MANKFQALLALLGKNKQAQGQQTPVNSQYQGFAQMLPQLQDGLAGQLPRFDSNALAQRNGTVNLGQGGMNPNSTVSLNQGGINPQTHPLLAGIKQGANKAKHYLLDPVYNTPTGDATIDATDPNKFTDSRLGRYGALALLTGAGFATGQPALGAIAGAKMVGGMRQNDLKEYQARLGKKAMVDEYANWGYKPSPLLDEKQQAEGFKLFIENERNRKGNELLAEPDTTARIRKEMTPPQVVKVDPVTGKKTYATGLRQNPYAIIADPKFYAGKQQREQQKQNQKAQQALAKERIEEDKQQNRRNFLLATQRINLTKAEQAQQERQFQQTHGLKIKEFDFKVEQARKQKPEETTQLERAYANGQIDEQTFVNAITNAPRDKFTGAVINTPLNRKKDTPKATPKQSTAQNALLPAPNRTPQGGYQTSAGTLPAFNITVRR